MGMQSSGAISLSDIQTEFGGTNPISLSEYYGSDTVPSSGAISFNDFYGTSSWTAVAATGGTVTTDGDYKVHTFTGTGSFVVTTAGNDPIDFLIIGAGGAGHAAGGGGGEYKSSFASETSGGSCGNQTGLTMSAQSYTVTIGAGVGGIGQESNITGTGFSTITSGGGGCAQVSSGDAVGSGAGGYTYDKDSTLYPPGDSSGCGNTGGTAPSNWGDRIAGGGGAGAVGGVGSYQNGGVGLSSSITGSAVCRAGGGSYYLGSASCGGSTWRGTGAANTGGGGSGYTHQGHYGGSGLIVFRYKYQ